MNWYFTFYLFSIVDNLSTFFGWMAGIFTLLVVISWIVLIIFRMCDDSDKEESTAVRRGAAKWVWYSTPFFVFFWLAYIATPSKKDMLLIIAGGSVGEFVSTDANAKQLPADITKFLRAEILKATAELGTEYEDPNLEKIRSMSREELEKLALEKLDSAKALLK